MSLVDVWIKVGCGVENIEEFILWRVLRPDKDGLTYWPSWLGGLFDAWDDRWYRVYEQLEARDRARLLPKRPAK